jgi:4-amino-4-deoxy-L-arabinose transferase-like glycosyltransferase
VAPAIRAALSSLGARYEKLSNWTGSSALAPVAVLAAGVGALLVPAAVGPDASMYAAVATSLLHHGTLALPDGSLVVDRPPLFSLLAAALGSGGVDVVLAAVLVSKLGFVALVGSTAALARRVGGNIAALLAVIVIACSPLYIRWTSATLLDGLQGALLVLAISAISGCDLTPRRGVAFGLLLGLSFLTKESAVFVLVVPMAVAVLGHEGQRRRIRAVVAAWVTFAVVTLPWFGWVGAQTGRVFLLGLPILGGIALGLIVLVLLGLVAVAPVPRLGATLARRPGTRAAIVAFILVAWVAAGWWAIDRTTDVPVRTDLIRAVYRYVRLTLLPDMPLLIPAAVAAAGAVALAVRRRDLQPAALGLLAGIPVALLVATRSWEARSLAGFIGLAVVLAGVAISSLASVIADGIRARGGVGLPGRLPAAAVVAACLLIAGGPTVNAARATPGRVTATTWDRPLVRDLAGWLAARTSPGETVIASWQYAAMLFVRGNGQFDVAQVPLSRTVTSALATDPLVRVATMDSWQDRSTTRAPVGAVVYASDFPQEGTVVVLEEARLQEILVTTRARWMVIASAGPTYRSGANYPDLGGRLGGQVARTAHDATGWISIQTVPPSAALAVHELTISPAVGSWVVGNGDAIARQRLDALSSGAIRVWPVRSLQPSLLASLASTGRIVAPGSADGLN